MDGPKQETSSIGWFKLAQLVTRKEKERALGLFRLLSYSFDNKAYALQLEGDLLWAFDDRGAIMKYKQAAFLYQKEQKIVSALGVYEHLLTLEPANFTFLSSVCECYALLDWQTRLKERFAQVLKCYEDKVVSDEQLIGLVELISRILGSAQKKKELKAFLKTTNLPIVDRLVAAL